MIERQEIIMACMRVEDLPIPHMPAHNEKCMKCGAEVWCSEGPRHDAVICLQCVERERVIVTSKCHPDVMRHLLAKGYDQADIERIAEYMGRSTGPRMEG